MARFHGLVATACTCLFLVTGCTLDSYSLTGFGEAKGDGPVVAGSLNVVAASTQATLRDMGLFVNVFSDGETAKLTSTTPGGKRFTLLLKARKTDHGDETQLNIHWEKDADDAFWLQLGTALAKPKPKATPAWEATLPPPTGPTQLPDPTPAW